LADLTSWGTASGLLSRPLPMPASTASAPTPPSPTWS